MAIAVTWSLLALPGAAAADPPPLLVLDPRAAAILAPGAMGQVMAADSVGVPGIALANGSADGGCSGWSLLREPGATGEVELGSSPLGRFSPDEALRAVGRLSNPPAHMVLVAAGPPQCVSVACSVSRQVAARHPGVRIDVLASPAAGDRLRCVAANTGGQFQRLAADGLVPALTALIAAKGLAVAGSAASPPHLSEPSAMPARSAPDTPPTLPGAAPGHGAPTLSSVIPIPRPAPRRPAESASGEPGLRSALAEASPAAESETTPLAADDLVGDAKLRALPWVGPSPDGLPGAPEPEAWPKSAPPSVRLQTVAALGEVPLASELSYEVTAIEPDGSVRLVGRSWAARPTFALPAGAYVARVTYRGVSREYRFHTRGKGLELRSLPLDIGYVTLRTVATAGAPLLLSNVEYTVRLPGGAPVIRRDPQPLVALPAGQYEITVRSGAARATATVAIEPGETLSQTFDLRLGYLRLRAGTEGRGPVAFRVMGDAIAGFEQPVRTEVVAPQGLALLRLPGGRYVATADHDGRTIHREVTVAPGELTQVTLQPQTAQIESGADQF